MAHPGRGVPGGESALTIGIVEWGVNHSPPTRKPRHGAQKSPSNRGFGGLGARRVWRESRRGELDALPEILQHALEELVFAEREF